MRLIAVAERGARFTSLGLSGYDALYAALAEELSADLSTGLPEGWPG